MATGQIYAALANAVRAHVHARLDDPGGLLPGVYVAWPNAPRTAGLPAKDTALWFEFNMFWADHRHAWFGAEEGNTLVGNAQLIARVPRDGEGDSALNSGVETAIRVFTEGPAVYPAGSPYRVRFYSPQGRRATPGVPLDDPEGTWIMHPVTCPVEADYTLPVA